jgi:hypothetical protein
MCARVDGRDGATEVGTDMPLPTGAYKGPKYSYAFPQGLSCLGEFGGRHVSAGDGGSATAWCSYRDE